MVFSQLISRWYARILEALSSLCFPFEASDKRAFALVWKLKLLESGGWDEEAAGRITTLLLLPINSLPRRFAHLHIFLSRNASAQET